MTVAVGDQHNFFSINYFGHGNGNGHDHGHGDRESYTDYVTVSRKLTIPPFPNYLNVLFEIGTFSSYYSLIGANHDRSS